MCSICDNPPDRMAILFALPHSPGLTHLREQLQAAGYDAFVAPTFEEADAILNEELWRMELVVVGDHMDERMPTGFAHTLLHRAFHKLTHNMAAMAVSESPEVMREMVMCCCSAGFGPESLRTELEHVLRLTLPAPEPSQ